MIIPDVNVLLYAFDPASAHHQPVKRWLDAVWSGEQPIGLPWLTAWGFVRITTNPRIYEAPLTMPEAIQYIDRWLHHRSVRIVHPGPAHLETLASLAGAAQVRGPETTNAILAALAVEHGATLASTDQGFRRFPGVKWLNPAAA